MSDLEMQEESRSGGCMKPLLIGCGVLFFLSVVGMIAFGVLIERGVITFETGALRSGDEVPPEIEQDLREIALEADEAIVWFSGMKMFSFNIYGNVLTDRRVVFYALDEDDEVEGDHVVQALGLAEVDVLEADFSNGAGIETRLLVSSLTEDGARDVTVFLILPGDDGLDHRFVEDLVSSAREAGAEFASITFGGDVDDAEIESVQGAVRGDVEIEDR